MGGIPMFSISQAIINWRNNFKQYDQFSKEDLDELESHLRDEISVLKTKELTDEEAFIVAKQRLGTPNKIQAEYQKANPNQVWKNRFLWMLSGFVLIALIKSLIGLTAKSVVMLTSFFTLNLQILFYIEIIIVGICILVIGWGIFNLIMIPKSMISRIIPKSLNILHYILIAFFISIGQALPRFIGNWMGSIHHSRYWEIWPSYGTYLGNIQIANYLVNSFLPLILFFLLLAISRTFNKTKAINETTNYM
jgi:hypothetical protein